MEMTRQLFFTINCIGLYNRFLPIYPASRSNATASARAATVRGAALCALLLALVFLTGCRGFSATGGPGPLVKNSLATWQDPSFAPQKINQVVVMPLEGEIYRSLPRDVQEEIFAELNRSFGLHTSLEILTTEKHVKAVTRSGPQVQRAAELGQTLGVQGVIYGVLTRYHLDSKPQKKRGGPSGAGFRLWLVKSGEAKPLWSASFEKSEKPLSDNLFLLPEALKRGVGFKSSKAFLKQGFSEAAVALEQVRDQ